MNTQIPEGFTPWSGGACPVALDTGVDVILANGTVAAGHLDWGHSDMVGDIIAYRVTEEEKTAIAIPEGFTPWAGGECPVGLFCSVEYIMRGGDTCIQPAKDLRWLHTNQPDDISSVEYIMRGGDTCIQPAKDLRWLHTNQPDDIIAYRVIQEEKQPRANDMQVGGDHYKTAGVQPWEVIDTWALDQRIGFYRGNALKYVMRMGTKDENSKEIKKAAHYLQKLAEVLEEKGGA